MFGFRLIFRFATLLMLCLFIPVAAANAATYYVSPTGNDSNSGSALTSPYATIQHAIDKSVTGDTILIVAATYTGSGNKNLNFGGKDLTLQTYPSSAGATTVTLDLQNNGRAFLFQTNETSASVIDSFNVINGYEPYTSGGAAYIKSSSPTFTNCTFDSNSAFAAGAVYIYSYATPTFTNCVFSNNTGKVGGAIYTDYLTLASFTKCKFTGNTGRYGGGVYSYCSSDSYTGCTFDSNTAELGGALYTTSSASLTFTNCTLTNNTASDRGGASFTGYTGIITLYNCVVANNSASNNGGAFYNSASSASNLYNSTVTGNSATYKGGAVYNGTSCSPIIFASILWKNTAGTAGNELFNAGLTSLPIVTYTDITGGWDDLNNTNLNVDPLFVSATDFHLQAASAMIDAGPNTNCVDTDMDDNPRICNYFTDLGAYERSLPTAKNDTYSMSANTTLTASKTYGALANDLANRGGTLSAVLVSSPQKGTLTFKSDGSFTYKAATGFTGTQTFTYKAKNSKGMSTAATVIITIK